METKDEIFDITIIGAGPVGLYAAFYAGMRGLSVHVIEVAEEIGGQPVEIYPEKDIYDIAGLPHISGAELSQNLLEQLSHITYSLTLGQKVETIEKNAEGIFKLQTNLASFESRAILLATGNGLITPRKVGVDGEDDLHESGKLAYFVKNAEDYRGKSLAILGGGDSALDWALMLENIASEVHVVHRREAFRAHEMTTVLVKESSIQLHTPFTVAEFTDAGLKLAKVKEDLTEELTVDKILVSYGYITSVLDIMEELEVDRNNKVLVDVSMASNVPGIYAAGDGIEYRDAERVKVPLISVGFGEAVTAISSIMRTIDFGKKLNKGHSSSLFEKNKK